MLSFGQGEIDEAIKVFEDLPSVIPKGGMHDFSQTNYTTDEYGFTKQLHLGTSPQADRVAYKTMMTGWNSVDNLINNVASQAQTQVTSLLKVDDHHDKSTRLMLFLKK